MSSDIFISYRRADSSPWAGRLYDALSARFGEDRIFMDVDKLAPGADFAAVINAALDSSAALIAVIGPDWLGRAGSEGRRLDDPDDFVRREIEAALGRAVEVIPVLVGGAAPPTASQLPDPLANLAGKQAISLHEASWHRDVAPLMATLEGIAPPRKATYAPAARSEPRGRPALEKLAAKFRGFLGETRVAPRGGPASPAALDALDNLARAKFGELRPLENLLRRMGSYLADDESVLDLTGANYDSSKFGLLALTDRRTIFVGTRLGLADLFWEASYAQIDAVACSIQWDAAHLSVRLAVEQFRSAQVLEVNLSWEDSKHFAEQITQASGLSFTDYHRRRTVTAPATESLTRLPGPGPCWKWDGVAEIAHDEALRLAQEALMAIGAKNIQSVGSIALVATKGPPTFATTLKIYCQAYLSGTTHLVVLSRAPEGNLIDFGSSKKNVRRMLGFFKQQCELTTAEETSEL